MIANDRETEIAPVPLATDLAWLRKEVGAAETISELHLLCILLSEFRANPTIGADDWIIMHAVPAVAAAGVSTLIAGEAVFKALEVMGLTLAQMHQAAMMAQNRQPVSYPLRLAVGNGTESSTEDQVLCMVRRHLTHRFIRLG
jgi:hypothetical protein